MVREFPGHTCDPMNKMNFDNLSTAKPSDFALLSRYTSVFQVTDV